MRARHVWLTFAVPTRGSLHTHTRVATDAHMHMSRTPHHTCTHTTQVALQPTTHTLTLAHQTSRLCMHPLSFVGRHLERNAEKKEPQNCHAHTHGARARAHLHQQQQQRLTIAPRIALSSGV
jgi:hypothetical protein